MKHKLSVNKRLDNINCGIISRQRKRERGREVGRERERESTLFSEYEFWTHIFLRFSKF